MVVIATLALDRLWINRLDTGEAISAYSRDRQPAYEQDGEVLTFAGGRQRAVGVAGEKGTFAVTLRRVPLATVDLLREWKGLAVQVRDHRGQRWVGTYFAVSPKELDLGWYDAAITVRAVTAAEGV